MKKRSKKRKGDLLYRICLHPSIKQHIKTLPGYFNRIMKRGVFTFDLLPQYWKREDYIYADGDFVRNSTLELVAREIKHNNVEGAVAELGVFKGDFARLISMAFPDRQLYLFDTFSGFSEKDIKAENEALGEVGYLDSFIDTNVENVLKRMKNRERCIVKKGYFPDTFDDINEKFAFVSIDCDLYKPIYDGLTKFWKNLSMGGIIFVHDYNNESYPGVKKAVHNFTKEHNIVVVPMSDTNGSAVIVKQLI